MFCIASSPSDQLETCALIIFFKFHSIQLTLETEYLSTVVLGILDAVGMCVCKRTCVCEKMYVHMQGVV